MLKSVNNEQDFVCVISTSKCIKNYMFIICRSKISIIILSSLLEEKEEKEEEGKENKKKKPEE